ncbi:MAG: response regulator [Candidatus Omnitrophota bacterium]
MSATILIIDDDEVFLDIMKEILEPEGFNVKTLSDPTKAEDNIEKFKPELLIIDIFMPERSGFNLIEDFREKGLYLDVPKMFLTCLDDDVERMTASACGVNLYMTKPFNPEELISQVNSALKGKRKISR